MWQRKDEETGPRFKEKEVVSWERESCRFFETVNPIVLSKSR